VEDIYYYYCNLHLLNTINLLKHLFNYNPSNTELSKSDSAIMPSMQKRFVESKSEEEAIGTNHPDDNDLPDKGTRTADSARLKLEVLRTLGGQTGAHDHQNQEKKQDQEKGQNQDQDQHQQEYELKKVGKKQGDEEPHGRQSGANSVQDQIQDQDQHQDQHQQEYERNEVEEKQGRDHGLVTWRKKMLRRMG